MQTIVAGYEGSEAAERALVRAAEIATAFGARLVVVAVSRRPLIPAAEPVPAPIDPSLVPAGAAGPLMAPLPPPLEPAEPEEPALRQLERARSVLAPRRVEADYVSAVGDPAEALLQVADEQDADVIVVGSREHGFLERLFGGGGVDEKLARQAHRDVLLVH